MRGKTRAHLVEADDGSFYVVKLANNRFGGGRRALISEFMGSVLLEELKIATPGRAFVRIDDQCQGETESLPVGLHFGSRYPGTPDHTAVYDMMPEALLHKVQNRDHFIGALVFDLWTANADRRQAIFFRPSHAPKNSGQARPYIANMIDQGSLFGGREWAFHESPTALGRLAVCAAVCSRSDAAPWIEAICGISTELLLDAAAQIPAEWLGNDEDEFRQVLQRLFRRGDRLADLFGQSVSSDGNPPKREPTIEGRHTDAWQAIV